MNMVRIRYLNNNEFDRKEKSSMTESEKIENISTMSMSS